MPRAVASFTLFGFLLCRLAFSQDGLQLFHKMQAALGGADKIAAIRDYRITSPAANVVRVSDGDVAHQVDLTLDPVSSLPIKTAFISLSDPARPVPSEEVVAEWETVQGIRFARRWSVFRSGIRVATATVDETRLNSGLEPTDLAAKPPDFKPVLSSR